MRFVSIARWTLSVAVALSVGCSSLHQNFEALAARRTGEDTPLNRSAEQLRADTQAHLQAADEIRQRVVSVDGPRTIENTLTPANEMWLHLDSAYQETGLLANVHPDEEVRTAAEEGEQLAVQRMTELSLDRELYDAYQAVDVSGADPGTQFMVFKMLRDFRRAGVDKDDETRARIKTLNAELVELGQQFGRTIREDVRQIELDSVGELAGLPDDWIAAHPPDEQGKIHINTDYPDYIPFITYAHNGPARRALYLKFKDRGYPANMEVLNALIAKRYELARILGYEHWADYITADKMIGSAANAAEFIDKVNALARPPAQRDYAVLLQRKQRVAPGATEVADWEKSYYEEVVKNEKYQFDSKAVRPYFEFNRVQQGLFDLTSRMFGIEYRRVTGLNLWHEDVSAWDVYEGDKRLGRFYLDLHPRPAKYKHAACFGYRAGIEGRQLPQSVLVCNFPNPRESDGPALMVHDQVQTFFHEFGHLLHAIFGGHQPWVSNSGINTEWDFVEAPSQMLEEWVWNVETLQVFAKHYETNEPIPAEMVERMRGASDFGKGLDAAHQMFYAAISLSFYNRDPATLDTTATLREMQEKYSPFDYVEGTHFQCNFGHLDGYSAIYYTYMWSLVIAKDLFSKFEENGLLDPQTSMHYRRSILDPGGSKKAAELIRNFLGRDYTFDAFEAWLSKG